MPRVLDAHFPGHERFCRLPPENAVLIHVSTVRVRARRELVPQFGREPRLSNLIWDGLVNLAAICEEAGERQDPLQKIVVGQHTWCADKSAWTEAAVE